MISQDSSSHVRQLEASAHGFGRQLERDRRGRVSVRSRSIRRPQCSCTATCAAKMSDFFALEGVALPQLRTRSVGESVEIPNVSPGHTDVSPNSLETCTGADSQPFVIENVRRYWA